MADSAKDDKGAEKGESASDFGATVPTQHVGNMSAVDAHD